VPACRGSGERKCASPSEESTSAAQHVTKFAAEQRAASVVEQNDMIFERTVEIPLAS
jgi:hypothetical protein